jgi:hypothetical protein
MDDVMNVPPEVALPLYFSYFYYYAISCLRFSKFLKKLLLTIFF